MKLTEIKKLKVSELRSRLRALGLDAAGLKAELVGRLWSAVEAGLHTQHAAQTVPDSGKKAETQQHDSPTEVDVASSTDHLRDDVTSTSPPRVDAAPCKPVCTDTATQTEEADTGVSAVPVPLLDPERTTTRLSEQGWQGAGGEREPLQQIPVQQQQQHHTTGALVSRPGAKRRAGSVSPPEVGQEGDAGEDRRSAAQEQMGRGRAFYEFKEEIRYKRAKSPPPHPEREEEEEEDRNQDQNQDQDQVRLDPHGSHLHFEVEPDGAGGQPRFWARFPLLWSGCRLTHGVLRGRVGFEVRLERKLLVEEPGEAGGGLEFYGLRVGWSAANGSVLLGEDQLSYAYDGCGRKVWEGTEEEFGEPFSEGDIIGCYASFSTGGADLSFYKNGRPVGVAFSLDASVLRGRALFPHVLCKSCTVRFLLDPTAPPWYPGPPGFTPLAALPAADRLRAPPAPTSRSQCEVVMMVGLPGAGKSHWVRTFLEQHPDKHFTLLGTEELLACMLSRGQSDVRLQMASQCLTELIKMAAQTPGNYILNQPNVLFSARRHKLQLFGGFRRRVVVVFPSAEEWKRRLAQHQAQNREHIPETALLKLQVSCSLPEQQEELMEELQYVELPQEQAQMLLQEYREEAHRLLPPIPKQERKKPRLHKNRPLPCDPPPSRRSQWKRRNGWNGTGVNLPWWGPQPRYWTAVSPDQSCYYNRGFGYSASGGFW
ncbi:heterogeneous nuclear ribonucleoprotein U-like protein 2 [Diretmus argenteus]